MKVEELIAAHRSRLLTRDELFAGLTAVLASTPTELDKTRGLLRGDPDVGSAFEGWLDDLKFHPEVLYGNRVVDVRASLLERLGTVTVPPDAQAFIATLRSPTAMPTGGLIGAQARIAEQDWSVAIQTIAHRFGAAGKADLVAVLSFKERDAPSEAAVQQAEIELFQAGRAIGVAIPSRQVASTAAPRELDDEFLPDVEAA